MSTFRFEINKVTTNGPYCYTIWKEQDGKTCVNNVANVGAAMDGVKTDIAGLLSSETIVKISGTVSTLPN